MTLRLQAQDDAKLKLPGPQRQQSESPHPKSRRGSAL
jgi:hypothetical protein